MLQASLLFMKSLNRTETPIFRFVMCSLFPKAIVLPFILVCNVFFLENFLHKFSFSWILVSITTYLYS